MRASNWCQQQCWIYKTCNSRHFPDAYGAFNKKHIHHSKCCALNAHMLKRTTYLDKLFRSFSKQAEWLQLKICAWIKSCKRRDNIQILHTFLETQPNHEHWQEHCYCFDGPSHSYEIQCDLKMQRQHWNCPSLLHHVSKVRKVNCMPAVQVTSFLHPT